MVENQVDARARHQHRQPPQELDRIEHQVGRPITPRTPEGEPHLPVFSQVNALLRDGRAQDVATHPLEPRPLPGRHDHPRMQIEAVRPRVAAVNAGRLALPPHR